MPNWFGLNGHCHSPSAAFLGSATSGNRYELESKLKAAQRDYRIAAKQLEAAKSMHDSIEVKGIGLLSEAKTVGLIPRAATAADTGSVVTLLRDAMGWKPEKVTQEHSEQVPRLEGERTDLRKRRRELQNRLDAALQFESSSRAFEGEVTEQHARLQSIGAPQREPSCRASVNLAFYRTQCLSLPVTVTWSLR